MMEVNRAFKEVGRATYGTAPRHARDTELLGKIRDVLLNAAKQIEALRAWDLRWSETSVPTALAIYWGDEMRRRVGDEARATQMPLEDFVADRATPQQRLEGLEPADAGRRAVLAALDLEQRLSGVLLAEGALARQQATVTGGQIPKLRQGRADQR